MARLTAHPIRLTEHAEEKSTYTVQCTFFNSAGTAITPTSITWTLTDPNGIVINSRENIAEPPSAQVYVVLSGDDLDHDDSSCRILTINAIYSDAIDGIDKPLRGEVEFFINKFVN